MTLLPVADGARLLGIHPKTLHHWLKEANVPLAAHPTDARITCVTEQHLQQVARRHDRPLQASRLLDAASPALTPAQMHVPRMPENEVEPASTACLLPTPSVSEANLIQKLSSLETKIVTLQEQLAQLALALLQERERAVERRLSVLETMADELMGRPVLSASLPTSQATRTGPEPAGAPKPTGQLHPAEQRVRSRMPALIEYSAQGTYVIISSLEGELHLVPDSPQWFDWLATLPSFRFIGKQGRLSAYCDSNHGRPSRSWIAHRNSHNHLYRRRLGVTSRLTIAHLEQTAAKLQADVDTL